MELNPLNKNFILRRPLTRAARFTLEHLGVYPTLSVDEVTELARLDGVELLDKMGEDAKLSTAVTKSMVAMLEGAHSAGPEPQLFKSGLIHCTAIVNGIRAAERALGLETDRLYTPGERDQRAMAKAAVHNAERRIAGLGQETSGLKPDIVDWLEVFRSVGMIDFDDTTALNPIRAVGALSQTGKNFLLMPEAADPTNYAAVALCNVPVAPSTLTGATEPRLLRFSARRQARESIRPADFFEDHGKSLSASRAMYTCRVLPPRDRISLGQ